MPIIKPMSPVRVVRKALIAASEFALLLPPVADEHERAEPDQLPADEQLRACSRRRRAEHRRGEERQTGEVPRVATVAVHVRGRVHLHEQRHHRDDEQHHHRETVDIGADAELDTAARHHVTECTTGVTTGVRAPPREHDALPERGQAFGLAGGVLDPVDPLDGRDAREHERRRHRERCPISAPFFGSRLPKNMITKNETAGIAGMSQALSSIGASALQLVDIVEVGAAEVAVDQEHDRQTDTDLGGGDRDHEQREHLPGDVWVNAENAMRLMFTAFSISSTLIRTSTPLRRASTP